MAVTTSRMMQGVVGASLWGYKAQGGEEEDAGYTVKGTGHKGKENRAQGMG